MSISLYAFTCGELETEFGREGAEGEQDRDSHTEHPEFRMELGRFGAECGGGHGRSIFAL